VTPSLSRVMTGLLMIAVADRAVALAQGADPPRSGRELLSAAFSTSAAGVSDRADGSLRDGPPVVSSGQLSVSYRPWPVLQTRLSSGFVYQGPIRRMLPSSQQLFASFAPRVGPVGALTVNASVGYQPLFSLVPEFAPGSEALYADLAAVPDAVIDYGLSKSSSTLATGGVAWTRGLGRRTTVSANLGRNQRLFADEGDPSLRTWTAGASMQQTLTRDVSVVVQYSRQDAGVRRTLVPGSVEATDPVMAPGAPGGPAPRIVNTPLVIDDVTATLVFNRGAGIRLSRRASLDLSTGSSFSGRNRGGRSFFLNAGASLSVELAKQGTLVLSYTRGANLTGGFAEPVYSDALGLDVRQTIRRRLTASAGVSYSSGSAGLGGEGKRVDSMNGSLRANYALTRRSSAYVEAQFYQHSLGAAVVAAGAIPREQVAVSVRGGFSMQVPLLYAKPGR